MDKDFLIQVDLILTANSPLHIGTGLSKSNMIDKSVIRKYSHKTLPSVYLPGSSIKGRVRYHYILLYKKFISQLLHNGNEYCRDSDNEKCCAICQIFGSRFHQGRLIFSDAELSEKEFLGFSEPKKLTSGEFNYLQTNIRRGNKISRRRRVALEKHLFTIETASIGLQYKSSINGMLRIEPHSGTVPKEICLLFASLRMVDKIGGGKSRGLGTIRTDISATINGAKQDINDMVNSLA